MMAAASRAAAQTASANGILRTLSLAIIRPVPPGNGSRSLQRASWIPQIGENFPQTSKKVAAEMRQDHPTLWRITVYRGQRTVGKLNLRPGLRMNRRRAHDPDQLRHQL